MSDSFQGIECHVFSESDQLQLLTKVQVSYPLAAPQQSQRGLGGLISTVLFFRRTPTAQAINRVVCITPGPQYSTKGEYSVEASDADCENTQHNNILRLPVSSLSFVLSRLHL